KGTFYGTEETHGPHSWEQTQPVLALLERHDRHLAKACFLDDLSLCTLSMRCPESEWNNTLGEIIRMAQQLARDRTNTTDPGKAAMLTEGVKYISKEIINHRGDAIFNELVTSRLFHFRQYHFHS